MAKINSNRLIRDARAIFRGRRTMFSYGAVVVAFLVLYGISKGREVQSQIYHREGSLDFKNGRILGGAGDNIYEGKERLFSKTVRDLLASQSSLKEMTEKLQAKIEQLEKKALGAANFSSPLPSPEPSGPTPVQMSAQIGGQNPSLAEGTAVVRFGAAPEAFGVSTSDLRKGLDKGGGGRRETERSLSIISFPVKDVLGSEKVEGIVLPAGSYVKAKLMTGIEAPEGKTFPVLLQLDFAYIIPNKKKLDLSGCFMIAKSQGDLSTERVQMQTSKLSCVSRAGRMFEREVNGFIADDRDNSFAVIGKVNSKQDRVASMAFLSSIVEGVGKAIGQAGTTQTTTPLGGSQSVVTGDQMTHMAAGGAANAAGLVTQWYLKQAQNLLPTINVGSGQDVWIIMQDSVGLPNDFFRKNLKGGSDGNDPGMFSYLSRVSD